MKLAEMADLFVGQDIYVVGTGPSASVFPFEILYDQVCIGLNDAFKMHPAIGPVALMHHHLYSRSGKTPDDSFHDNFRYITHPVVKDAGKDGIPNIPDDEQLFYTYRWSHNIEELPTLNKSSDTLYYTPGGSALHAGLQLAWILGARRIFVIGCDATTLGERHYSNFNKNGFRDDETLKRGEVRDYDSYIEGTLRVIQFLDLKGIPVLNLSGLIGYRNLETQLKRLQNMRALPEELDTHRSS